MYFSWGMWYPWEQLAVCIADQCAMNAVRLIAKKMNYV